MNFVYSSTLKSFPIKASALVFSLALLVSVMSVVQVNDDIYLKGNIYQYPGLAYVRSSTSGNVIRWYRSSGSAVKYGETIAMVRRPISRDDEKIIIDRRTALNDSIQQDILGSVENKFTTEKASKDALIARRHALKAQIRSGEIRSQNLERQISSLEKIAENGFYSRINLDQKKNDLIQIQAETESAKASLQENEVSYLEKQAAEMRTRLEYNRLIAGSKINLYDAQLDGVRSANQVYTKIVSPRDGRLHIDEEGQGMSVDENGILGYIEPKEQYKFVTTEVSEYNLSSIGDKSLYFVKSPRYASESYRADLIGLSKIKGSSYTLKLKLPHNELHDLIEGEAVSVRVIYRQRSLINAIWSKLIM